MKTLNRNAIQEALAEYKEAMKQHEQILNDNEVQSLFEEGKPEEAGHLADIKFPLGRWEVVTEKGLSLIKAMINGVQQYEDIEAMEIWRDTRFFNEFVKLAERV